MEELLHEHVHTKDGDHGRFDRGTKNCELHLFGADGRFLFNHYEKDRKAKPCGLPLHVGGRPWDEEAKP